MTTRSRPRPRGSGSYTARLQDRAAARRRARPLPVRPLAAALTLAGEAGHLAAALVEWPGAPIRGLAHILAAAGIGLLTMTLYFGQSRVELVLGIVATLVISGLWLAGAAVGLSLYRDFPVLAAVAVSAVEVAAAVLLTVTVTPGRSGNRRT